MSLLPKSSKVFSSKQYWDEFFSRRGAKAFEWYGEYAELCGHLNKYMRLSDKVLVAGCGSSAISADLYKSGFRQITNIDISEIVIRQMKEKYEKDCSKMKWIQGDLFSLPYESESFSCILDKGTLDGLVSENTSEARMYFQELGRVLRVGGRYICISLLQEHILSALFDWFLSHAWFMRFCRCEDAEKAQIESGSFSFPVFVIICTKFRMMDNFKPVIELNMQEEQPQRVSAAEVRDSVASFQQFAMLRHNLKKKLGVGEEMTLDLCDSKTNKNRYRLFIVDSPKTSNQLQFAVFIVPHGRESEWIFNKKRGQLQLAESVSSNRLVVVHLMRDQIYKTMKDVQIELSSKVLELAPSKLAKNYKIPFLSTGDDLGERKEVCRGKSKYSGEFLVEDVKDEASNCYLRRLIFLHNQNLIQSEAKLVPAKKKKAAANSEPRFVIDPSYLSCAHHTVMLSSLELTTYAASLLLVGLGGGTLATYIHKYFPKVNLTTVDIDEEVVKVAKDLFNFRTDSRLKCEVEDGVQFITKAAQKGDKYDIVMFDVDSKELSEGLSCPPKQFVERSFLYKVASCVSEKGLFALNLVCRDRVLKKDVLQDLKAVFPSVLCVSIPEEVNAILFCQNSPTSQISKDHFEKQLTSLNQYLKLRTKSRDDVLDLREMLVNFLIL